MSSDLEPVRRFEVFTGSGRRREWLPEEKARIVADSYEAGETVSAVARRYALSRRQLFAWRRAARLPLTEAPAADVDERCQLGLAEDPRRRNRSGPGESPALQGFGSRVIDGEILVKPAEHAVTSDAAVGALLNDRTKSSANVRVAGPSN
ncbi:transposase [Mesorhizobium sp. M1328]|uniref:transposase n=1 Tax=Mesorhizobium sp. M1328 TaxID=2957082 RepID=UPI003337A577